MWHFILYVWEKIDLMKENKVQCKSVLFLRLHVSDGHLCSPPCMSWFSKVFFFFFPQNLFRNLHFGYGSLLTQGSNPHLLSLLHWKVDSWPLHHLGSHIWVSFCLISNRNLFKKNYFIGFLSASVFFYLKHFLTL